MSTVRETGPPRIHSWPPRACEGADTALFFPATDNGRPTAVAERRAKVFCDRCHARPDCAAYAVPVTDLAGIWAGMNANERTRARKKQQKEAG